MLYNLEDIKQALQANLAPEQLEILDDSGQHYGHQGYKEGQITHITVKAVGKCFEGKSRVAKHRMVNAALKPFFDKGLHAVQIKV